MTQYEELAEAVVKFLSNVKYPFRINFDPRQYKFYTKWTAKNKLAFRRYWKRFNRLGKK